MHTPQKFNNPVKGNHFPLVYFVIIRRHGPLIQLCRSKNADDLKKFKFLKVRITQILVLYSTTCPRMYSVNICLVVCMPLVWLPLASRLLASCCPWFWKANSCCSPWVSGAEAENRAQGEVSGEKSNEPAFHWALVTSSFCHHLKSKLDISLFPRCLHLASLLSWKHGGDTCPQ